MTRGCGNKAKLTGTVGQPNRWKTLAVASEPKRAQPESTPVPMPESISPLVMSPTAMSPKTDADFPYSAPLSPVLVTSQIPNSNKYGPPSENFQPRDRGTLCVSNLPKIGRKAPCDADSVSVGVSAAQVQVQRPPPMAMNNNDGLPPLRLNDVVKDTNNGPRAPIKENLDMRKHCVFDFTSLVPAPLPAPVPGPVPGPPPGPPVVLSTYDPSRDPRKDAQAKRPAPPPLQRRSTSPSRLPKGPPPAPLPTVPHPLTRTARNTIFETCPSQDIVTFMADRGKRPNPTPAAESNKRPRPEDRYVPTDRYRPEPHDSRDYDRDRDRDRDRRDNRFCSDGRWNDDRRGNSWHQTDRRRWSTDGRGSGNRR
jgi:hypothetical protein